MEIDKSVLLLEIIPNFLENVGHCFLFSCLCVVCPGLRGQSGQKDVEDFTFGKRISSIFVICIYRAIKSSCIHSCKVTLGLGEDPFLVYLSKFCRF